MRPSTLLLALPVLSTAQQVPFLDQIKAWFGQATASISSAIPSAPTLSIPNPISSAAKKVLSNVNVEQLTLDNHKQLLKPGTAALTPGFDEWMVYVTGGNKTCYGMCQKADEAFAASIPLLQVSTDPPNIGMLNCEAEGVLCNTWMVNVPGIVHIFFPHPQPDQSAMSPIVRYIRVNRTSITAPEVAAIHLGEKYKETEPYEGFFHPFSGPLATVGLDVPLGYLLWGFAKIPSWAFMVGVSFISRTFMGRRVAGRQARTQAQAPAPAAGQ